MAKANVNVAEDFETGEEKMVYFHIGNITRFDLELLDDEEFVGFLVCKAGYHSLVIWDKVFKNGPSEICGRQPLKNLKW